MAEDEDSAAGDDSETPMAADGKRILHDAPGVRRWITITEDARMRYLLLDGCEQGAMYLDSDSPVFHYLWFHKCSHLTESPMRRGLVLGAGAFTAAKCLALDHADSSIVAVDEEAALEELGRRHFRLNERSFSRIAFAARSAEQFLAEASASYDFVFDDLFDGFQHVPIVGRSSAHVARLRAALSPGGVCIKNVIWSPLVADARAACDEVWRLWQQTFAATRMIALGGLSRGHNRILVGWDKPQPHQWPSLGVRMLEMGVPDYVLNCAQELK